MKTTTSTTTSKYLPKILPLHQLLPVNYIHRTAILFSFSWFRLDPKANSLDCINLRSRHQYVIQILIYTNLLKSGTLEHMKLLGVEN